MHRPFCNRSVIPALVVFLALCTVTAQASTRPSLHEAVDACRALDDPERRLACYDALPGASVTGKDAPVAGVAVEAGKAGESDAAAATPLSRSAMTRHWELDDATDGGLLHIRRHEPVYLLPARWTNNPLRITARPGSEPETESRDLDAVEVKFQLSLKTKLADNLLGDNLDLWAGYTQQSNWQAYNSLESEPFRETNYAPEVFASLRTGIDLLGWRWQMLNLGFMHQSNGRSDPFSRSWNRVYTTFGFERGDLRLLIRPWWIVSGSDDDNPDIDDYLGHGDVRLDWSAGRHDFGLTGRWARGERRGALQFDWHYPLYGDLNAYLQVFTGYGETMIDYRNRQTTIGLGISLVH